MFWKQSLIGEDLRHWIEDNYDWVHEHRPTWWKTAQLVTPTRKHFSATHGDDHKTAQAVTHDIMRLLGMDYQIQLEPLPELPDELRHEYGKSSEVVGEYWHDDDAPLITYRPSLLRTPLAFINTMVHELIHARLAPVADELPGGLVAHELATDLHCIIAGFGVIQLQAAEQMGWTGYMTQPSRAVALAEFLRLKEFEPEQALKHLSGRPNRWLKKAMKAA
ncbi:hypothetical protein FEE96_20265 [Parasedimentitalea maritima]|uniref:Uncharacterized protein n=1 Tax=Parasedimentitalea maritima TaxID=2578117 RepID=A0ABY2URD9_9RHOB|nr:hypothetical protein [Zongyanglinia marina]TLP56782.1 hypothetical protein FEE96_20265 [Zongyanglinia marina]